MLFNWFVGIHIKIKFFNDIKFKCFFSFRACGKGGMLSPNPVDKYKLDESIFLLVMAVVKIAEEIMPCIQRSSAIYKA